MSDELARRDFLRLTATAAGGLALASCRGADVPGPRPTATATSDFRVGQILPISGPSAEIGDSIRKGMQLYLQKVGYRAGGRRIVVAAADEGAGDTSVALAAVRKLVEEDHADLVTGIVANPNALAIRGYVHERRVPTLVSGAGINALSRSQRSPYVYRTSFSDWQHGQPMGQYLVDWGIRRLALVYSNDSAGLETAAGLKETYSGQVLAEVRPPSPNPGGDFAAFITRVNNVRPAAIYAFLSGGDAIAFLTQARLQLDGGIRLTGSGFLVEQDVVAAIGEAAPVGALTGLHWALGLDHRANLDFRSGFRQAFGRTADVFAVQGYDSARVIAEALAMVGGRTDDRMALMKAISQVRFSSPRGDFRFDAASSTVVNTLYVRQLVDDPTLGYTNRVISSVADVADPGR